MNFDKKAFFSASDVEQAPPDPGNFPFTRGIFAELYKKKPWTIRQYSGFGTPEQTNQRFHELIKNGQEGISIAFDLPTQMGLDADDPKAEGELGKVGVSISTLEDFEILLKDIPLERISISMTINSTAPILMGFLIKLAEKRGVSLSKLRGTVQNDILKEFIARGTQIYPLEWSLKLNSDLSEYCIKNLPNFNWSSISGYHIREAGASAVQELAFTFINASIYFEELIHNRNLPPEAVFKRTSFFFNCMLNLFEEVAKFRAARSIYAKMVRDEFNCLDESCQKLKFHTQTGGSALTSQGYYNNIVRACIQSLAAVLGGTQSLHCSSFDEALGLPTDESALVALRTQQIIRYETGIVDVTDPLGGSYYVEWLTNKIEKEVTKLIKEIKDIGALNCIKSGYIKNLIENNAYQMQLEIEKGERIIVGVNKFSDFQKPYKPFKVENSDLNYTKQRLERFKKQRDLKRVKEFMDLLSKQKSADTNIMPFILQAIENKLTLGEISMALR